jgi:hypothetical protein
LILTQDESFKLKMSAMLVPQKKAVEMATQTSSMDRLPTIPKEPLPMYGRSKTISKGSTRLAPKADEESVESQKIDFRNVLASFHESERNNRKSTEEKTL